MEVSVVLCTFEPASFDVVEDCIESLLDQTHAEYEVVIVVDGDLALFEKIEDCYGKCPKIELKLNDENVGLLASRNRGAQLSSGDVVAFIDDDAVADKRWLEQLVEPYEEHDALAVGGKMEPSWVAGKPQFLPAEFYWLVGVTHRGFKEGQGEVRNTFGSNLSFRREVFLELDGFNVEIGGRKGDKNLQGGETELCVRLRRRYGEGVYYTPDAVVCHKVFEYRTRWAWLLNRAFWQGYSKRRMEQIVPGGGGEESQFLGQLLTEFVPGRIGHLLRKPSIPRVGRLLALFVLTGAVGFGYLYAILRP